MDLIALVNHDIDDLYKTYLEQDSSVKDTPSVRLAFYMGIIEHQTVEEKLYDEPVLDSLFEDLLETRRRNALATLIYHMFFARLPR